MDRPPLSTISHRIARLGGVLRSLLLFLCGTAGLVGAALTLEPQALVAVTQPPEPVSHAQRTRDEFARSLAALIGDSIQVLAVHSHSSAGPASIVLWMHDDERPGMIDPGEVAVLSHNQLLRTITVYTMDAAAHVDATASGSGVRFTSPLDHAIVSAVVFCDRWRAAPTVTPRTIATGISDMRVVPVGGADDQLSVLQLELRWSADSADGAGEASALIERR